MLRTPAILLLSLLLAGTAHGGKYTHLVMPGDSLSKIAKQYHTSPERIRSLNGLKTDALREGQKLKVQSPVPVQQRVRARYRVSRGESLSQVAKRHNMSLALLKRLNPKVSAQLKPGQLLWVAKQGPKGSVRELYQLESGPGFSVLDPRHAYGTMLTVSRVAEVLSEHGIRNPNKPPVLVGDISRSGGGYLAPHVSHRRGRDVDIRYPLNRETKQYVAATADTLDVKRTWSLIKAFITTGDVQYVFVDYKLQRLLYQYAEERDFSDRKLQELFQYPHGRHSMRGIIRHEPGHVTHFHVRFNAEPSGGDPNS